MATLTPTAPKQKTPEELIEERKQLEIKAAQLQNANNIASLDAQAAKIPGQVSAAKTSAGVNRMQTQLSDNLYSAARGINSGVGSQMAMARNNVYGNAVSSADKAGIDANSALDLQRVQANNSLASSIAGIEANATGSLINQLNANRSRQDTIDANNKSDILNTLGAYSGNYQKKINEVQGDGDTSNDWMIPYLQAAREDKIANQNTSQAETMASIGDFSGYAALGYTPEQIAALQKAYQASQYSGGGGGGGGAGTKPMSYSQLSGALEDMRNMYTDPSTGELSDVGKQQMEAYISAYGGDYAGQFYAQYGITPASPAPRTGTAAFIPGVLANGIPQSPGYGSLQNELYGFRSETGRIERIRRAVASGEITDDEGEQLAQWVIGNLK